MKLLPIMWHTLVAQGESGHRKWVKFERESITHSYLISRHQLHKAISLEIREILQRSRLAVTEVMQKMHFGSLLALAIQTVTARKTYAIAQLKMTRRKDRYWGQNNPIIGWRWRVAPRPHVHTLNRFAPDLFKRRPQRNCLWSANEHEGQEITQK